jgi:SAM-dependent methyltransferase
MVSVNNYPAYDPFARIFNEAWGLEDGNSAFCGIEQLLLKHPHFLPQAPILDLCCGAGHLAQKLLNLGYEVTGIDSSAKLIDYANSNAPKGKFIVDDARYFNLPPSFGSVVSTSFGINHIIAIEELICVFKNVYAALLPGGLFVFDLILDQGYQSGWADIMRGDVQEEYAWALKRSYNPETRLGTIYITIFDLVNHNWQRSDLTWLVKGYSPEEIMSALKNVGFVTVNCYGVEDVLVETKEASELYFVCNK